MFPLCLAFSVDCTAVPPEHGYMDVPSQLYHQSIENIRSRFSLRRVRIRTWLGGTFILFVQKVKTSLLQSDFFEMADLKECGLSSRRNELSLTYCLLFCFFGPLVIVSGHYSSISSNK
ncbi:hypothetical protein H2248_011868 [Termitomyces sp. 'cryptogamus']|nr:hypothetical protein H2248_011868 [Termitomyces sp. 'cryptogamus']